MKKRTEEIFENFLIAHNDLSFLKENLLKSLEILLNCAKERHTIFVCGNGGSASDSEHISGELLKSFCLKRPIKSSIKEAILTDDKIDGNKLLNNLQEGIKCIPLTTFNSFNTAFENDVDGKYKFAQLINVLGEKEDVLIAISTSGNSENIIYATSVAKAKRMSVIALTGENGGKLKDISTVLLNAPSSITYKVQEYHLPIYHLLCLMLESEIFDE